MAELRYIDANKAEKIIEELENMCSNAPEWILDKISELKNFPAADVREVVHARWVDGFCKNCGYDGGVEAVGGKMNFCPKCGAKMDKED